MGLAPRQSYPRYSSKWDFSSDAQEFRKYAYAKTLSFLSFFPMPPPPPLAAEDNSTRLRDITAWNSIWTRPDIRISFRLIYRKAGLLSIDVSTKPKEMGRELEFLPVSSSIKFPRFRRNEFFRREREGEKPKKLPTLPLLAQFWNAVLVVVEKSLIEYDGCGEGEGQATSFSRNKRSSIIIIHPPNQAEAISGVRSVIALLKRKAF